MNCEAPAIPFLSRLGEAIFKHGAEAKERARLEAQSMAAARIRQATERALASDRLSRNSVVVTQESDGTITVLGQMARENRRHDVERWLQYFTVAPAPNDTIMAGRTHPRASISDVNIDELQPFSSQDMEAVDILTRRMNEPRR